jgi:predicted phage tail protein
VVFGIELNWGFPANTDDTLKTEIQYSATGTTDDAVLLADVPYPLRKYQQMGLKAGSSGTARNWWTGPGTSRVTPTG